MVLQPVLSSLEILLWDWNLLKTFLIIQIVINNDFWKFETVAIGKSTQLYDLLLIRMSIMSLLVANIITAGFDLLNIGIRTALFHAPFYKFTLIGTLVTIIASFSSQMNLNFVLWVQGFKVSGPLKLNIFIKTLIRHPKPINSCWK